MNDPLHITVLEDKSNWKAFPLVFAVVLFLLIFLGGILSFIVVDRFFPSLGLFNQMIFLSLAVAAGISFGNRLRRLNINHDDLTQGELRDLTVRAIEDSGFSCEHESQLCRFRNKKKIMRIFSDWLGTEQIILLPADEGLSVTGPGRYLNNLQLQIRKQLKHNKVPKIEK